MIPVAKHVITVDGDVKPLVATPKQWERITAEMKNGTVPIHTNEDSFELFAVLEVAKGYQAVGVSNSKDGVLLLFGKVEANEP